MEFLFDNPFIIIIIIGAITSLFGKKKGEEQQRPKKLNRPVQRGPIVRSEENQPARSSRVKEQRPAQMDKRQPVPTLVQQSPLTDVQMKYEEARQEKARAAVDHLDKKRMGSPVPSVKLDRRQSRGVSLELKPEADRLIEGIAWAQVLGQPRSKDPHRTMRRKLPLTARQPR